MVGIGRRISRHERQKEKDAHLESDRLASIEATKPFGAQDFSRTVNARLGNGALRLQSCLDQIHRKNTSMGRKAVLI